MATKHSIAVIGSLNIDFITRTPRIPEAGETLAATSFDTGFGGKGANQAVACARLREPDIEIQMVGNVGDDIFGADYFAGLQREGIQTTAVRKVKGGKTGVANIIVDERTGENRILITANANFDFEEQESAGWDLVPQGSEMVLLQCEIPLRVVLHNMRTARERGIHVLLNPAPAIVLPDAAYNDIDTLIMNETESEILSDHAQGSQSSRLTPEQLAVLFLKRGVREAVIITLGSEGLVYATASGLAGRLAARKVEVVDTTAAGDTFVGAYAVQRVKHRGGKFDYDAALQFATLAASKSVERAGAMAAIPYLKEL